MQSSFTGFLYFIIVPTINFSLWYYYGQRVSLNEVPPCRPSTTDRNPTMDLETETPCETSSNTLPRSSSSTIDAPSQCGVLSMRGEGSQFSWHKTTEITSYRRDNLLDLYYPDEAYSTVINNYATEMPCLRYVNPHVSEETTCFAVGFVEHAKSTYFSIRYDRSWRLRTRLNTDATGITEPTGFFRKVAHAKARSRMVEKMQPFLNEYASIEQLFVDTLRKWGKKPGDDLILMVVNEGEIDLLLNFACSCRENNVTLGDVVVVVAAENILPVVYSMGFVGIYHPSFAYAPPHANEEYLDRTFIDMMWYKSFSLWVLLKLRYHVLFQDVDLVWFRDPIPFFEKMSNPRQLNTPAAGWSGASGKDSGSGSKMSSTASSSSFYAYRRTDDEAIGNFGPDTLPDGFFSDDGQRGIRYTPLFANSGFYYIRANPRTERFAWAVVTNFDQLQVCGSHQNIFNTRMVEAIDMVGLKPNMISTTLFPNGVKFHHDPNYMRDLRLDKIHPYHFHMCWTKNKVEKINNFKLVSMWYLKKTCGLKEVAPGGTIYNYTMLAATFEDAAKTGGSKVWNILSNECCTTMHGAPH